MWCCVGTGMENHSKYGHFAYTHDGDSVLYVNLFVPSTLSDTRFGLTQTTSYPYEQQSTITVDKAGAFTLAVRHPGGLPMLIKSRSTVRSRILPCRWVRPLM